MAELTQQDMAAKLSAEKFARTGPTAQEIADPIADTPMVVTLDQLRPYDLNPRVARNPRYDEILASIRERGLDTSPAITRRPGETHYIIRNGGNTRLAILRELWAETKDERFFRISCLFRPWSERGEIIALTGHLAENVLHGGLTFVERALGVEKARELYEQESGTTLTQTELARRLTADGYPITQPTISRMQDTVRYLLPAIPTVLYSGLGRPQIERLTAMRKAGARVWDLRAPNKGLGTDFHAVYHDVLAQFDTNPEEFLIKRVQDELVGQMAELLDADYDILSLEMGETERRQHVLGDEPSRRAPESRNSAPSAVVPATRARSSVTSHAGHNKTPQGERSNALSPAAAASTLAAEPESPNSLPTEPQGNRDDRLRGHIVSPAPTTERLQSIQRLVAGHLGDPPQDFEANVIRAIPVQAGGVYPISDVWYIEPSLEAPEPLRIHIAQLAREIADEASHADCIDALDDGVGYVCITDVLQSKSRPVSLIGRGVLALLHTLSAGYGRRATALTSLDNLRLADTLPAVLQGHPHASDTSGARLSDAGLVKLFRLIRLVRRLLELEAVTRVPPTR
jgi:ParB family protein of integrating conjugative element (PFGI_1 class)